MTHFQRDYRKKKERYEQGIESEINSNNDRISNPSVYSNNVNKSENLSAVRSPIIKSENVEKLVEGLDRKSMESKMLKEKANRQMDNRRSVQLNLMRLQDKQFELNRNIYNIAVGQIIDRQAYLMNLNKEISQLKTKIKVLEAEENEQDACRTIQVEERQKTAKSIDPVLQRSRTIEQRKSQCGRIYTRIKTPSSGRSVKFGIKEGETSSYYKWRPKVDENDFFQEDKPHVAKFAQTAPLRTPMTSEGKRKNSEATKPLSNYRVKQKNVNKAVMSEIECQTEDLKQLQEVQTKKANRVATKKSEQNPEKAQKEVEKAQEKVELEPYSGIVFQKQPVPEWQITKIEDNFRQKIMKKLQIPAGFPLDAPEIGQKFEDYQKLGPKIFELFGVKLAREQKKIITRKFKNGLYFQLDVGKNVVWYYSGTFYFGDWDVDLPTESQKNGFGFQYVPNKYIYLGYFKDGMRHCKGTIKIFSTNPENTEDFMAYDGEWANGKPNGFGRHIDQKNTKYIGDFKAGQKTGKAIILAKDGLYYEGEVRKNLKHGYGYEKLVNGDTYTGQFQDGKFGGVGTYKWKNGSVYEGEFVKGKRQGKGKWKGPNGDEFEGEYFEDVKNGWGKFTWANGEIYQGQFRNDIRHGQGTYRHPSGKVGKFMWIEGRIDHRIYSKEQQQYRCRKLKQIESDSVEQTPEVE